MKGDRVYTAVLRAYVKHLLRDRFPQEFYVEGGRSRTGKLLFPKTGLVSMEVDAWLDGAADDVLFVPIAIDYEKLIEASELRARARRRREGEGEPARAARRGARASRRYERLYVQFEEPISLARVAAERLGERAPRPLGRRGLGRRGGARAARAARRARARPDAKRRLVQALANRIAYGISRAVTITPVGLVAAALLSHVRRGLGAAEVARRVELLRYMAAEGGARFARDLAGAPSDPRQPGPIADAVRRLAADGLVRVEVAAGDTIYQVPDEKRPVLDYHRNAVIHRYVAPALVAAAARAAGRRDAPEARCGRARSGCRASSSSSSCTGSARRFDEIFDAEPRVPRPRRRALARAAARCAPAPSPAPLAFLGELLRAYLEAYRLAAATALALLAADAPRQAPVDRRALVREALERGRAAFLAAGPRLRESLSKATLENAVEWLVAQGIVSEEAGKLRLPAAGRWRGTPRHHGRNRSASRGVRVRSSPSPRQPARANLRHPQSCCRRAARRSRRLHP